MSDKQLISIGPSPFRTPQRVAAPSNTGTSALGYNAEANEFVYYDPPGSSGGDHGTLTGLADNDHPQYSQTTHTHGYSGELLISDTPSTPLVFADILQNEAQDDLIYEDVA